MTTGGYVSYTPQKLYLVLHACNCEELRELEYLIPAWPSSHELESSLVPLFEPELLARCELGEIWRPYFFKLISIRSSRQMWR